MACLPVVAPVQAAGLLDFLFGGARPQYQPPSQPSYGGDFDVRPLEMTIRPRRSRSTGEHREAREAKPKMATPIDPVAHPNWYLEDKTLRRGDIVVLKDRVLVYEGGRSGSLEAFSSLDRSRLVSKVDRARVSQMAGLRRVTMADAEPDAVAPASGGKKARVAKRSRSAKARVPGGGLQRQAAQPAPQQATLFSFFN